MRRQRGGTGPIWAILVMLTLVFAACGDGASATGSPTGTARGGTAGASDEPGATNSAEPSDDASESPAETDGETESPEPSSGSEDPFLGRVGATTVNRLRLRVEPGTSAETPGSLNRGTRVFVLDGPRDATGYTWYRVVPMAAGTPGGWIAAASQSGVPWIEEAEPTCPDQPSSVADLIALSEGERLACFSGVPLTLSARVALCNCDIEGPTIDPPWFAGRPGAEGGPLVLTEAEPGAPISLGENAVLLVVDPQGDVADPVPVGESVEVTGLFDHPAAAACTTSENGADPIPSVGCRFAFAVTSLRAGDS